MIMLVISPKTDMDAKKKKAIISLNAFADTVAKGPSSH